MRKLTLIPLPGTVTFATNSLALVIALVFSLAIASAQSEARAEQGSLLPSNICERHIDAAEISLNIPRQLLLAISVVESGVWHEERVRSTPWAWTVYAQKRVRRFDTKAEALGKIRRLFNLGMHNIDVGCMQVNLHYHGDAFDNLAEALDPAHNVAYAGTCLKKLYSDARSSSTTIARYHSWTPKFARIYHNKVKAAWTAARRIAYEDRHLANHATYKARCAAQAERKRKRAQKQLARTISSWA